MNLYIHSAASISAAGNNGDADFLTGQPGYYAARLQVREPDYTAYIPPMQLRRMSRAVRMSVGTSRQCLDSAGISGPDAIAVGTAMGCLQDTEAFLSRMITQEEQMLTPTAFIQSTHNTVAGQIALLTGCVGSNLTFAHRGHSFEHAVAYAQLYLQTHPGHSVLAGGVDELTDSSHALMQRAGIYTADPVYASSILEGNTNGALAGEGAGFFLIRDTPGEQALCVKSLHTFIAGDHTEALALLAPFVSEIDCDVALLGISGDRRSDRVYAALRSGLLQDIPLAAFKHLTGDWATASAFAVTLAAYAAAHGWPAATMLPGSPFSEPLPRSILIVNHFMNYWSCWHLANA